ncbi:hypothetical protein [Corallococcus sp. CA049B]|uniref:hypothetical protein n=1 Tax=Corallococcus sp. CA049B TaxID=2316730 RepID=UPI0011C3AFD8|nr:hypothetical protein [Corallococcus sp. CA049B]
MEKDSESAKNEVDLADYEVRTWTALHRHMTLCLVGRVFPAAARAVANLQRRDGLPPKRSACRGAETPCARFSPGAALTGGLRPPLLQEVRALQVAHLRRVAAPIAHAVARSRWRRHHQAVAMQCHDRARKARFKPQLQDQVISLI